MTRIKGGSPLLGRIRVHAPAAIRPRVPDSMEHHALSPAYETSGNHGSKALLRIVGAYTKPAEAGRQHFSTVRVEPQLAEELIRRNIMFSGEPEPGLIANFIEHLV